MTASACLKVLREGGVVAFPTDTFFALSCDALNGDAVGRLRRVKGASDRPLPVLIPDGYDCSELSCMMCSATSELMTRFWPGKLTLIVPCTGRLGRLVGRPEDGAVGLRVPGHPVALEVLRSWNGPLVGTSANLAGRKPACSAAEVRTYFGSDVGWVAEGESPGGAPSTVAFVSDRGIEIEREGAISVLELQPWIAP